MHRRAQGGRKLTIPLALAGLVLAGSAGFHIVAATHSGAHPWSSPFDGQVPAVNMAVIPDPANGGAIKVLYYSGIEISTAASENEDTDLVFLYGTEPTPGKARVLTITGYDADGNPIRSVAETAPDDGAAGDLFCSGITHDENGNIVVAGATKWYTLDDGTTNGPPSTDWTLTPLRGLEHTRVLGRDPVATGPDAGKHKWTPGPDMAFGRWYPTLITLANGDTLAASGIQTLFQSHTHNEAVETWDGAPAPAGDWATRHSHISVAGQDVGPVTTVSAPPDKVQVGVMNLPLYPRLFQVPGGPFKAKVLYATVGTLWGTFGERPEEALWSLYQLGDVQTDKVVWTFLTDTGFGARQHANTVPLMLTPDGSNPRYLTFGGTLQRGVSATDRAEIIDLSAGASADPVSTAASLKFGRWHAQGILLPNGKVLAVGGGAFDNVVVHGAQNNPILAAELYDPAFNTWTELAPMTVPRMYHSTAVLLPDARVLVGGHVPLPIPAKALRDATATPQVQEKMLEIFSPPYLFDSAGNPATRPAITGILDNTVAFGGSIVVATPDASDATLEAVLMRPGATTHAWDADQRGIRLAPAPVQGAPGTVTYAAPPDGDVAPPGWYMLFLLKDNGQGPTPSIAKWVRIG